jgi:hypothetical protein
MARCLDARSHLMANRTYLYATDVVPGTDPGQGTRQTVGISEWNYDIPIVYKLLLTGNPRMCKSLIWETPDNIALVGDYSLGLQRLKDCLKRIDFPAAQSLITDALTFLEKEENRRLYFLLECAEIFEMSGAPMEEQNSVLLEEIENVDEKVEDSLAGLRPPHDTQPLQESLSTRRSAVESLGCEGQVDPLQPILRLGLGNWTNTLYYDPGRGSLS